MTKLRSLLFAAFLALPLATSFAQVEFSVGWAPPPLPVVVQPECPAPGYLWTPGYWGWDTYWNDYYWVPGVWVAPPRVGLLWTPGWWGWRNGAYAFNQGYWGPTVGFYGGVNYGFGYTGNGYWGGRWSGNTFQYNTAVTRVNKTVINNTYVNNNFNKNVNASRTSFNGGNGGLKAQPNAEQRKAMANTNKVPPTSEQLNRQKAASQDQNLRASVNKGKPNQEAISSFNKNEGAGRDRGAQEVGAAGAGAGNKPGDINERRGQAAGAGKNADEVGPNAQRKEGADRGAGEGAGKTANGMGPNAQRKEGAHRGAGEGAGKTANGMGPNAQRKEGADGGAGAGAGKTANGMGPNAQRKEGPDGGAGGGRTANGPGPNSQRKEGADSGAGANTNKHKTGNQGNRTNMGGNQAKMHTSICIAGVDRKSTRLNSSHANISYAVFCLKKKKKEYVQEENSKI